MSTVPENTVGTEDLSPEGNTTDVCQAGTGDPDFTTVVNLHDSRVLLGRSLRLLEFYSDRGIADRLYKRDRERMFGLANTIRDFLDATSDDWEEDASFDDDEEEVNDPDPKVQLVEISEVPVL